MIRIQLTVLKGEAPKLKLHVEYHSITEPVVEIGFFTSLQIMNMQRIKRLRFYHQSALAAELALAKLAYDRIQEDGLYKWNHKTAELVPAVTTSASASAAVRGAACFASHRKTRVG